MLSLVISQVKTSTDSNMTNSTLHFSAAGTSDKELSWIWWSLWQSHMLQQPGPISKLSPWDSTKSKHLFRSLSESTGVAPPRCSCQNLTSIRHNGLFWDVREASCSSCFIVVHCQVLPISAPPWGSTKVKIPSTFYGFNFPTSGMQKLLTNKSWIIATFCLTSPVCTMSFI